MRPKFWLESLNGRDHLEDLGVDGRITFRIGRSGISLKNMDRIHLAEVRDWWWTLLKTVMNIRVP
jgi:hypothetical protein